MQLIYYLQIQFDLRFSSTSLTYSHRYLLTI